MTSTLPDHRRLVGLRRAFLAGTWLLLSLALAACGPRAAAPDSDPHPHLIIVVDGLRPDYVTPETMPTLTALAASGVTFPNHHSVYPTVTRVNASSISTGSYPETHGLLGNSVFFPRVDPAKFLDTSVRENLLAIARAEGSLLTTTTMGEALQRAGRRMLVVSSGSSGSAFLNNHTVAGGAVLHYEYALPPELAIEMRRLGPAPGPQAAPDVLDRYAVDAFLTVGVPVVSPSVTTMWLSGLDTVAHDQGIGAPATVATLRHVDGEIARIRAGLEKLSLLDRYNIWITSDHGFSTHTGAVALGPLLTPFNRPLTDGTPRIVAGAAAIYVRDNDAPTIAAIVDKLQQTPGIGAIFTAATIKGALDGSLPGTLSFDAIRWAHNRSAQILVSPDWTDAENANHMPGAVASDGAAGHGSSSRWDVHNTLIMTGPDVKKASTTTGSSANVDIAPTVLTLLGVGVPPSMQGRVLAEALVGKPPLASDAHGVMTHTVKSGSGAYELTATFSTVRADGREYRYFDQAKATRR